MPTITDPIQVSSDPQFRQASSEINPYVKQFGSNIYQVLMAVQTEQKIGVFKRSVSSVGGAWTEKDAGNSPDPGNTQGAMQVWFDTVTGIIGVLYLSGAGLGTGITICEFDTNTDTWSTPTAEFTYSVFGHGFVFVKNSSGDYDVTYTTTSAHAFYVKNSGGTWGSATSAIAAPVTLYGGIIGGDDTIYFLLNQTSFHLDLRTRNAAGTISAAHALTNNLAVNAGNPSIVWWEQDVSIATGWIQTTGSGDFISTIIKPLSPPTYTPITVYTPTVDETLSYARYAVGLDGTLNAFVVATGYGVVPIIDRIYQMSLNFVAPEWDLVGIFYDETANPPPNNVPDPTDQFIHDGDYLELPQGWAGAFTMETNPTGTQQWCTGFFGDPTSTPVLQTLQLNKEVVGGSLSAADFILTGTGNDSPATVVTGPGPQVGPSSVPAITFDLSEAFGPTWNDATGTWSSNSGPWNGGYVASAWVCTGGGTMPDDHTIIIPPGANIICTIVNTAPIPPIPPQPGSPCGGPITPQPATDVQFELRRVYASMKPAPRIPVRGS